MKHGLLIIVIFLFVPSLLFAQGDSTASGATTQQVFLSGGMSYPYLPTSFKVNFWSGMNIGVGYGLSFAPGTSGYSKVYAAFDYNLFRFDEKTYIKTLDTDLVKNTPALTAYQRPAKIFTFSINYQGTFTALSDAVSPYFTLGIGYMYLSIPPLYVDPATSLFEEGYSKSTIMWSAGFGFDVPINETLGAFVQVKSVLGVLDDTRQYFPVDIGVHYSLP